MPRAAHMARKRAQGCRWLNVLFSHDEHAAIAASAKRLGLTIPAYVRAVVLLCVDTVSPRPTEEEEA